MVHEDYSIRGKMAKDLIDEGSFSMVSWEPVFKDAGSEEFLALIYAVRNALNYASQTKRIKGIVRAAFDFALKEWNLKRKKLAKDVLDAGDMIISAAEEYIKKNRISTEN